MNRISKIFQPISIVPKNAVVKNQDITSKSQKLMLDLGLIRSTGNGTFHILPLAQRAVDKCTRLIDFYMRKVDAQKMSIPVLTSADLWKKSGRFESSTTTELLTTIDRHDKMQILGPTHEEAVAALLASAATLSYRQFPLRLYQTGYKFRDERKPRFGLMRAKEFLMKDCYSFDVDAKSATETYRQMNNVYRELFTRIGVPYVDVQADTGSMGGSESHEYQYPADVGEDVLVQCAKCSYASNVELCASDTICPSCKRPELRRTQGIEVAHTFLLEDRYTKAMGATYLQPNGKPAALWMGCYGIGITRLIAASLECLSTETELRWPVVLAPFTVCIVPPKDGSKEQRSVEHFVAEIYHRLNDGVSGLHDEIVVDDRCSLTIGKRVLEAKRFGYPVVVVIGPKAVGGGDDETARFECHLTNEGTQSELSLPELVETLRNFAKQYSYRTI